MVCILAVFIPAFLMQGAAQRLFAPLALAVGFAMIGSYLLSSTFVPVVSVWLLRHHGDAVHKKNTLFDHSRRSYESALGWVVASRWLVVPAYLAGAVLAIAAITPQLGQEIFPVVDAGQFRMRVRAPDGTHIVRAEQYAKDVLALVDERSRPGQHRHDARLRGHDPAELPGERRVPVVAWAGGGDPVCRSQRRGRH